MRRWCLSANVRLSFLLSGCLSIIAVSSVWAGEKPHQQDVEQRPITSVTTQQKTGLRIPRLSKIEHSSTSAQILAQSPAPTNPPDQQGVIEVTGVQANPTEKGVEVILQTTLGEQLQITNRSAENNFIADIPNAQLRLPSGDGFTFRSQKPLEGITEITVTNLDANTIRVTVAGETRLPTVELFDSNEGLIFALTPATTVMQTPQQPEGKQPTSETPQEEPLNSQGDEPIELVVTGEQDTYRVPNSSVGTRTDTPLRDIPQSIQVVPQEVLRDQNVTNFNEALRNVPGVTSLLTSTQQNTFFTIRGFSSTDTSNSLVLRNGLREAGQLETGLTPNIERIEVFKGPASVLFGGAAPGGTINLVTKQPLRDPFYALDATIGNYDFYQGEIDLSGPLNDSGTVLYRLNTGYQNRRAIIDFYQREQFTIAPVISWDIGERTRLTLEGEYTNRDQIFHNGLPAEGTVLPNPNGLIPRSFLNGEPDANSIYEQVRVGYQLEHQFSDDWSLRNAFQARWNNSYTPGRIRFNFGLADDQRTLNGIFIDNNSDRTDVYDLNLNLTGRFSTGSISHQLVFGVDLGRFYQSSDTFVASAPPLDLFNPVYGLPPTSPYTRSSFGNNVTDTLGIYLQNQVTLAENLKLLLGGRFDLFERTNQNFLADTESSQSGDAFSPRLGIVYQPIEPISLYASYSRSFAPSFGTAFDGNEFQPERGTQYEVGVKADLNDRLSATLALYDLTRSNVTTTDTRPGVPPGFSIQTGEQRSRGVELSIAGEILPGWNILAGYAYTDAKVTEDNTIPEGNSLANVSENMINFWTTYEIQSGDLRGLGVGLGLFFVGERQGDLANSFQLPGYLRTDAAIFYRRDQFRVGLNFRNLFDVDYFESSFGRSSVYRGDPFTVQGTISWQF